MHPPEGGTVRFGNSARANAAFDEYGCTAVIPLGIMACMAMTLRLTNEETEELRAAAESAGVSMQSFIKQAALNAARERTLRRDALIEAIRRDRREVLDRLGSV